MSKAFGAALLVVAVVLLAWGINSSESLTSAFSRVFRGTPTDRTIWFIIGGTAAGAAGIYLLAGSKRKAS
jgi:hypothetical protein